MDYAQTFHGIVLFTQNYREKDRLVKIFTREAGKKMFFVRNLQQPNHLLASSTLPFTKATFLGHLNASGFSFLNDSTQSHVNRRLHEDVESQAVMTYLMQLVDAVMDDHIVNTELYDLLSDSMDAMDGTVSAPLLMHFFELKMLKFFGVAFQWESCLYCDEVQGPFDVSTVHQGLLCYRHLDRDPHRLQLSPRAVHIARQFVAIQSPLQIMSVRVSNETQQELKRLCDTLMDDFVGIRLKSKKFIDQMTSWQDLMVNRRMQHQEKHYESTEDK